MSLTPEQLQIHCETILQSRRISKKVVVLCEGSGGLLDLDGRPSPQSYRKMEQMPDANFYKACVPRNWRQNLPVFFNCGDRKDVIDTYFTLLELHNEDPNNSYLDPDKLFAIVDLDLQVKNIDNYKFADTEEIFQSLYTEFKVNEEQAKQHQIWVTGLIHKEAYFLLPDLQSTFDNLINLPIPNYNDNALKLDNIYTAMADEILTDLDLTNNFARALKRIQHCSNLDCSGLQEFQASWKHQFKNTQDEICKKKLVFALLTIKKAKSYWTNVKPPQDWTRGEQAYRDQLLLKIAEFYSENSNDSHNHISFFFEILRTINGIKVM